MNRAFMAALAVATLTTVVPGATATRSTATPQGSQQPAPPNSWTIDPDHSAAHFSVRHLLVTTVRGQLGRITGTVQYDGKDVRSVSADIRVDVKGLTTQNPKRDEHLRSDDFFDVAHHPVITFISKRVEPGAAGSFKLVGDLTIRGTTKEVALDVEGPTPPVKGLGGIRVGATATTRVKRLEYGLKYNEMVEAGPVVGNDVTITIDVEVMRPALPGSARP
jgi:polyisoprenoid-binding protein YceI